MSKKPVLHYEVYDRVKTVTITKEVPARNYIFSNMGRNESFLEAVKDWFKKQVPSQVYNTEIEVSFSVEYEDFFDEAFTLTVTVPVEQHD